MQTVIDTELIQFEEWTLRVRSSPDPKRLLVLIHGFTGDENSMWVFARDLPSTYWMIAPRAPYTVEAGGYSWCPRPSSDLGMPSLEQLRSSAEALIRLIDAYQSSAGIEAGGFDVMGFSQGGVMSSVLAFLYPQRIRKVGILAGFVPLSAQRENEESGIVPLSAQRENEESGIVPLSAQRENEESGIIPGGLETLAPQRPLEGKSVFVAHGTKDETVTIDRARASIVVLEKAGAHVTYCEDEVGHKLSVKCLQALKNYFSD